QARARSADKIDYFDPGLGRWVTVDVIQGYQSGQRNPQWLPEPGAYGGTPSPVAPAPVPVPPVPASGGAAAAAGAGPTAGASATDTLLQQILEQQRAMQARADEERARQEAERAR